MKQAIVNFCKSMDTGLFLLDMPTGFGKTYSVLDFMVDNYDAPEFKDKKIFFVTTLKKNLPDKELREHFARRGKADDYDKYCLRIEANADMVVEKLDELYRARKIPAAITMKQEFKDLHGSVKLLNEYRDKKRELKGTSKDIINVLCKNAEDAIRKQQEGAFRKVIESELKQFRTPKEKLKNIANNPEYHWIGELYPAVYTRAKRIFFMSMDKFFLGNTTIIEPTYSFYNNDITKNAIIFIDEFDATRDRLLNQIITRGLENHIDYLGLFHRVYASLKTRDFPAELTTASKLQQAYLDEHKNAKNPMEIIEGFGGVFDETYDRFAMQYSFKTEEDGKGDRSRNFIFNDLQFHSVFEGENAFIDIDTDMKAKQNWLRFTKRRPTEKEGGVLSLLASVKGCLTYFQNGARNLSFNYKHHKDEDKRPGDDDYTFENAIESVLTEFHLSREQIRYLKPIVMGGQVKSKKDKKDSNGKMSLKYFDRSVYNRGFRYYDFIDDPNHSMRSEIQLFDFQDSPEHILLHLSEKAQIIGISATATLETVVGNYDLEYLQRMLQDKYYVMPEADRCRLQESFQTFVANYDKVNIHVEPVSYNADDRVELSEIFNGNEALIKKYAEKLSISFERVEYAKNNFIRVVKVMKAFILNDSVKSFLCLNNKLPQENKGLFDIKLLEEFADAIIKLYGIKGLKGKDLLYSINSEDYDAKRAEFIQRLSKGEKLFVISSYNTVGAGQNLQYKAPGNATIVAVNDYDRGDMEKDFDCIYLEKPTNLLVNVDSKKGIEAEDLIRFVYQMEFLMERGEVSRKDGIAVIKDAFICFSGGYTFSGKKGEPYKTDSVNNFAIRTLIQAVGRICRTGLKNPDIYIYVDNTILTDYDLSVVEQRMLNPEFAELVKVGKTYYNGQANENLDIAVMENRAGALALKAMQIINELKRNWTDDSIHDKSFYSDSEVDPHQESMEDYVVQHITVENFKHQSSAAVYNILKELVIKKDIAIGKITLVDWSQYGYKADWLFGVVVDGTYYFMTIHPDGSFKIEALKRNLFSMTEYDKYMDYFGLNEENKNDYRGVIGLVKDAEGNINLIKDTNMYSMPDYTAMGDVLKNVASEGRFPGKDVVTWLRLVMDTTDKIKVHAELDIVIPHIDVNAEYTKANVMGLFKGITTKKEVVRYVFENTGIMLYAYLRGEEERREYLSGNIDINYFDYDDTHAKYSVGEIGNGMKYTIERASVVREIQAVEGSKLIFKKVLPLMGVEFVRYGMLTVVPFPFKYLREYIVKEEKSV